MTASSGRTLSPRSLSTIPASLASPLWLLVLVLLLVPSMTDAQTPATGPAPVRPDAAPQKPPSDPSAQVEVTDQTGEPTVTDPARLQFAADATGVVLVTVKADKVADYEAVLAAMHEALRTTTDETLRAQASGWRVYKARESDAKAGAIYIHVVATPVADVDYRPSAVLSRLVGTLSPELLTKYRDAFAAAPTMLTLDELRHFGGPLPVPAPEKPAAGAPSRGTAPEAAPGTPSGTAPRPAPTKPPGR